MTYLKHLFLFSILISSSYHVNASNKTDQPIVLFGDSYAYGEGSTIIEGQGELHRCLEEKLNKKVINLGVSGETSDQTLERLPEVIKNKPSLVIVSTGGNDIIADLFGGNFPAEKTFSNMDTIFKELKTISDTVVHMGLVFDHTDDPETTRRLPEIEPIAKKNNVIFIPEIRKELKGENGDDHLPDGLHPDDEGYLLFCKKIIETLPESASK